MNRLSVKRRGWGWFHFLPLRDMVDRRTAPVNDDFLLVFGDTPESIGGRTCETGYTDFRNQRCWVNTTVLPNPASEEEQIITATFIAAHERAHARWTEYVEGDFYLRDVSGVPVLHKGEPMTDVVVHQVWNILEDERIERLLMHHFRYLGPYLVRGSQYMLRLIEAVTGQDSPEEVIKWVLRRRVLQRANVQEDCPLSPTNVQLLHDIEPLLDEAFSASSSRRVVEIAREIVEKLNLNQSSSGGDALSVLSGQLGQRPKGTSAEAGGVPTEIALLDLEEAQTRTEEGEGEARDLMQAAGYSPPSGRGTALRPAPYEKMRADVQPHAHDLRQMLQPPVQRRGATYDRHGTRLSMRAARRTPETPFRVEGSPSRYTPIALTVVIDESGSMAGSQETEAKRLAMLCAEALYGRHKLRVVLAPTGRPVLEQAASEMGKAFIAGYTSDQGTEFGKVLAKELKALQALRRSHTCYLLLIADGLSTPADNAAILKVTQRARTQKIHTIGIGVRLNGHGKQFMEKAFRDQFVEIDEIKHLTPRMHGILQRMAHRTKH